MARVRKKIPRIPKKFNVMGHTMTVNIIPDTEWLVLGLDDAHVGYFEEATLKVYIRGDRAESAMEQIFWHEALHCILHFMGHPLNNDETFVDVMSGVFHQILITSEY